MKKLLVLLVISILFTSCSTGHEDADLVGDTLSQPEVNPISEPVSFTATDLNAFYDELMYKQLVLNPEWVDYLGDLSDFGVVAQHNLLTDASDAYAQNQFALAQAGLAHLFTFQVPEDHDEWILYEKTRYELEMALDDYTYRNHVFNLSTYLSDVWFLHRVLTDYHPLQNQDHVKALIQRLKASEDKLNHLTQAYLDKAALGFVMDPYSQGVSQQQIRGFYKKDRKTMAVYTRAVAAINTLTLSDEEKAKLSDQVYTAIDTHYAPALEALVKAFDTTKKMAEDSLGAWHLPQGDAYYEHALKKYTTTDYSPQQVHDMGLAEVARIQTHMLALFKDMGYEGSLIENMQALRLNDTTYTGHAIMDHYSALVDDLKGLLPDLFLPQDLPIDPVGLAPFTGGNFYIASSLDGKRSGVYYLDMSYPHTDMGTMTLAAHETVPGHHLQQEHENQNTRVPLLHKLSFYGAYVEGWALYAESLVLDDPTLSSPNRQLGYLASELHRAARLVVDTGIHY